MDYHCQIITKGDDDKSKKGRVVILVRDMASYPVLHFYQVSPKDPKRYSSSRADTKFFSNKLFKLKML